MSHAAFAFLFLLTIPHVVEARASGQEAPMRPMLICENHTSRSLQSICKDHDFVIRFSRMACGGGNDGCEGDFGKEVCCAAKR